jgi:hypothetical protein
MVPSTMLLTSRTPPFLIVLKSGLQK